MWTPGELKLALALQAAAIGVPFLPTRSALGSDIVRGNDFFAEIESPFAAGENGNPVKLHAVRALSPDIAIVHLQRADREGDNAK